MNFKSLLIFCMCLLLSACASKKKEKSPAEKRAETYYNQGTMELVAKDYTLALQKLLRANELKPNDSKICNNLGMTFYFKNDYEKAVRFVKKAIKLDPKNTDAKLNLATIYMNRKEFTKAKDIYKNLLKDLTYTGHNRTYYNLALINIEEQNISEAITNLNKSIEVNENYCPAYYKLGEIAKRRKNYKKALDFYKSSSMGTCYNQIKPHFSQVDMMIKLNRYDDARIKLDEMLEKFALTKHEAQVKLKIEEVNRARRNFDNRNQEYSQNLDRNFLSTDF